MLITIEDIDSFVLTLDKRIYHNKILNYNCNYDNKSKEYFIKSAEECFRFHNIDFNNKLIKKALILQVLFYCGINKTWSRYFNHSYGCISPSSYICLNYE